MRKIAVRAARKADMPFILEALGVVAKASRQHAGKRDQLAKRLRRECWGSGAKARILIATAGKEPAGLMLYSDSYFALEGLTVWVSQLYVAEHMRGQSVGDKLWKALKAKNPAAKYAHWATDNKNRTAQKHFKRIGARGGKYLYFYKKL